MLFILMIVDCFSDVFPNMSLIFWDFFVLLGCISNGFNMTHVPFNRTMFYFWDIDVPKVFLSVFKTIYIVYLESKSQLE